ncbi:diguanylate cyclase [Candidatus Riflebacteria bacterium]
MKGKKKGKEAMKLDGLTGAFNHDTFLQDFQAEMKKAEDGELELSLLLTDIDFFKNTNDKYGHFTGDEVIRTMSRILMDAFSTEGTVYRFGGEEFAVIMPDAERETAFLRLEEVRREFCNEEFFSKSKPVEKFKLTFSGGISSFPSDGQKMKEIIRKADEALYRAKINGRNKICLSREEKMIPKTSYYTQSQLARLAKLARKEGVGESILLREALDNLIKKYNDRRV